MSFLQRILRAVSTKASEVAWGSLLLTPGRTEVRPKVSLEKQAAEGYEANVTAYACVNEKARSCAGVKWCLYRENGEDEIESHPILNLIRRPNPRQGQSAFITQVMAFREITGNTYLERVGPDIGPPTELYSLRPDRMIIVPGDKKAPIQRYDYEVAGRKLPLKTEKVLHWKYFSPTDDWYGLSPIKVASGQIDTDALATTWNLSTLGNMGVPSGALKFKAGLTDEQFNKIKIELKEQYLGAANARKPLVLDGDFDWVNMALTALEMDWLQGKKLTKREICQVFQVPPELIGDSESKTYSNYQEARKSFYCETILPILDEFQDELNNWLTPLFGEGLRLVYDKDEIDALQEDRAQVWLRVSSADWLTINEQRTATGYEELPEEEANIPRALMNQATLPGEDDIPEEDAPDPKDEPADETEEETSEDKSFKAWNLETREQRVSYWKSFDTTRRSIEAKAKSLIAKKFSQEKESVLSTIRRHGATAIGEQAVVNVLKAKSKSMRGALVQVYRLAGMTFFRDTLKKIPKKDLGLAIEKKNVASALREMTAYFSGQSEKKVEKISETTTNKLSALLREMILGGKPTDEVVDAVESLYVKEFEDSRAKRIAETEVGAAANAGVVYAGKSLDRPVKKAWVSMGDERVRDPSNGSEYSHLDENVKAVDLEDMFQVSGEQLDFPGDTSHGASAGNVINCRCATSLLD